MKTFLSGMIFLSLTSLVLAQGSQHELSEVNLEPVTVSALNSHYLQKVKDHRAPAEVRRLQNKAASFDLTAQADYNKYSKDNYEVIFKGNNGDIIAQYTPEGKIQSTQGQFRNVVLPMAVRNRIFTQNRGWKMKANRYKSRYFHDRLVKSEYQVTLEDGNRKRKMTIDLNEVW